MKWSDIPFDTTHKTLRQFAGLWLVFLGGLALYWGTYRGYTTAGWILGVLALTVGPLGILLPQAIRPIWMASLIVTFPIGWVVSHTLLGVLYYGMFTPLSLIFRLIGRDALVRRRKPAGDTFWIVKPVVADVRRYYRQF